METQIKADKSWQDALLDIAEERSKLEKNGYSCELEIVRIIEEFIREQMQREDSSYSTGSTG